MKDEIPDVENVLFLGAGFSIPSGIAPQKRLLKDILEIPKKEYTDDVPSGINFYSALDKTKDFLKDIFGKNYSERRLEDIFTLLDTSIHKDKPIAPTFKMTEIKDYKKKLYFCIIYYLYFEQYNNNNKKYNDILNRLISKYGKNNWCTITLNWDIVWDEVLRNKFGHVDYCAEIYDINDGTLLPSTTREDSKNLKLHGSCDWFVCQRCERIFRMNLFDESEDVNIENLFEGVICPACFKSLNLNDKNINNEPNLEPIIITPTFKKKIKNIRLQMIWNRALHLLSRVKRVIFIGYSFPLSDYHIRNLLARSVLRTRKEQTKITVILAEQDRCENDQYKRHYPPARYKDFFNELASQGNIEFNFSGVEKYYLD